MPNRYRLKGATLEEIRRKAEQQYGPAARIVSAERVISPGIAGLFAQDRYEAMVEVLPSHEVVSGEVVPDADVLADAEPTPAHDPAAVDATGKGTYDAGTAASAAASAGPSHHLQSAAIAALLEEADAAELSLHRSDAAGVSTESPDFAELLEQLGAGLGAPAKPAAGPAGRAAAVVGSPATSPAASPVQHAQPTPAPDALRTAAAPAGIVPAPLSGVGDLVVLVGLGEDPLDAALAMSMAAGGADVRTSGNLSAYGHLHVDGRQSATAARAHAVLTERTVLVAFGLGKARNALARVQSVAALSADQIWLVVDAGRKHEDTKRWVGVLAAQLNVTAVAVVGASETRSPETVNGLGLPVGWIDAGPAGPAQAWQNRPDSSDAPRGEG
ncbi:hypothetical protein [Arthrobacter sp. ov118]|uniref:hypothetical protein n=1 Tax=Arthrobacter sp. ov118 TaxID=1761747 RepID=UPI0008EC7626|nr:hypothetical protein [Arthrobacter sp. ov118]SFU12926.1 hypothetical protein SAMN04487915_11259 [Arthrobacter sp. ov118]